jgi:hypothetical protein
MLTGVTDWIAVQMKSGKSTPFTAFPVVVRGTMGVGEAFDKDGYLISLYRLSADRVDMQ